jgi:hypothetical protein
VKKMWRSVDDAGADDMFSVGYVFGRLIEIATEGGRREEKRRAQEEREDVRGVDGFVAF